MALASVIFFLLIVLAAEISVSAKEAGLQDVSMTVLYHGRKMVVDPVSAVTTSKRKRPRRHPPSPIPNFVRNNFVRNHFSGAHSGDGHHTFSPLDPPAPPIPYVEPRYGFPVPP